MRLTCDEFSILFLWPTSICSLGSPDILQLYLSMFIMIFDADTSQLERALIHSPVTFTVCYLDYSAFYCFLLLVMACH